MALPCVADVMNKKLRSSLVKIAERYAMKNDVSHDIRHVRRVLANAEFIGRGEKADLEVLVPAALFHDAIVSPKDSPKATMDTHNSAKIARKVLDKVGYEKEKINRICYAIETCSFSKGIMPKSLEAKILQDADGLESMGAISIMRTFASTGPLKRPFYDEKDAFAELREPDGSRYALDLFRTRLMKVRDTIHTKTAKKIAERRTKFLHEFIKELKDELNEVKLEK